MAIEIELKVRLEESELVKKQLSLFATFLHAYEKHDAYWTSPFVPFSVRVRREIQKPCDEGCPAVETILITYKTKEITDGIEVNDEREFSVSEAKPFEELLGRLGLKPGIKKEKSGWAWRVTNESKPPVLAELSMVKKLGWFLELEILAEKRDEKIVAASRKRLLDLLAKLEIPATQIEDRSYSQLLREANESKN